jgi:peptidoglycan/xylan/chitin deacetylase (PgdA/CDA1 family)
VAQFPHAAPAAARRSSFALVHRLRDCAALALALGVLGCATAPPVVPAPGAAIPPQAPAQAPAQATAQPAAAPAPAATVAGSAAKGPEPAHDRSREEESADIRKHHLKRLNDRLTIEASVLAQGCRYESDISTAPPPGRVALTFDDGPEPGQTERILDVLAKHGVPATFFMIGKKAQKHPELVALVRADPRQTIGNHSWDHPNFHDIDAAQQAQEVLREEPLLAEAAGPVRVFRYPYGNSSCETNELVHARGYRIAGWHIDSCDWAFEKTGTVDAREAISCGVLPQFHSDYVGHVVSAVRARKGGIILMHEIHPNTIAKLEEIIVQIRAEGFTFGSIMDEDFQASLR